LLGLASVNQFLDVNTFRVIPVRIANPPANNRFAVNAKDQRRGRFSSVAIVLGGIDRNFPGLDDRLPDKPYEASILPNNLNGFATVLPMMNQELPTASSCQKDLVFLSVDVDRIEHLANQNIKLNPRSFKPVDIHHSPPYAAPKWFGKSDFAFTERVQQVHQALASAMSAACS
jgi:hypothetical protein